MNQIEGIENDNCNCCNGVGDLGWAVGLRYVYEGNVPGEKGENHYCYKCNSLLIDRYGFYVRTNRIRGGCCPDCGASIDGIGMAPEGEHSSSDSPLRT